MNKKTKKIGEGHLAVYIILILGMVIMLLPFIWMVLTSLKSQTEATSMNPFHFFPTNLEFVNYSNVIKKNNFLALYWNTFSFIALRLFFSVTFSAMAAYAFARLEFPGKKLGFSLVLFQMMVPPQIFTIPQYLMVDRLQIRNTVLALVFPGVVSAFGTFLLRQFFMGLPKELEESAKLDGCSVGRTFFSIMLPLVKSGLVALGIFTALFAFKDLMWSMIVNTDLNKTTLSAALARLANANTVNYPELMAAAVISIIPMIVLYFIFQKQFIEGIATSGSKL